MNTDELRWFAALAEREHMTATARELHISQPALSRAIGETAEHHAHVRLRPAA